MRPGIVTRLHKNFEDYVHVQDDVEFWFASDLQNLLGYSEWRNFLKVIEKARESCKTANHAILDHFVGVNKSIPVPKGGAREIEDIMLTRYACYLIAQSYFAVQTRKQEIIEEHIRLSERLKARKATIRKFLSSYKRIRKCSACHHTCTSSATKTTISIISGIFFLVLFSRKRSRKYMVLWLRWLR